MQAAVDFRQNCIHTIDECDQTLNTCSQELIKKRAAAVEVMLKRIGIMEGILEKVSERTQAVRSQTDGLHEDCQGKRKLAQNTVAHIAKDMQEVREARKRADAKRQEQREKFTAKATDIQNNNVELHKKIQDLLAAMRTNETTLRNLKAADREQENKYQEQLAVDSQKLGTMAGCLDEMQNFE